MPHVKEVLKQQSPSRPGFTRVVAQIHFKKKNRTQEIWYEYPCSFDQHVSDSGDCWLLLLLPCAFLEGEDLHLDLPVDPLLLRHVQSILRIWGQWYIEGDSHINVTAPTTQPETTPRNQDTLVFFSGGLDSHFSLFREIELGTPKSTIFLATVWGLDIPLANSEGFSIARDIAHATADDLKLGCLEIATNLRELPGYLINDRWYAHLSFGSALASIGLLFSDRFKKIVIASGVVYGHLFPWGSHPIVDHLFSTSLTRIEHDGAECTRVEKTAAVLLENGFSPQLRVCWGTEGNCSKCSKCLRTMVTINLLGNVDECKYFDFSSYSLDKVASVYLKSESDELMFWEIYNKALQLNRLDIAKAVKKSIKMSSIKRKYNIPSKLDKLAPLLANLPFFWRIAQKVRQLHKRSLGEI